MTNTRDSTIRDDSACKILEVEDSWYTRNDTSQGFRVYHALASHLKIHAKRRLHPHPRVFYKSKTPSNTRETATNIIFACILPWHAPLKYTRNIPSYQFRVSSTTARLQNYTRNTISSPNRVYPPWFIHLLCPFIIRDCRVKPDNDKEIVLLRDNHPQNRYNL